MKNSFSVPSRDPWYKAAFEAKIGGKTLSLQVPHDVFSTQRIDEGTLLLLEHLPTKAPEWVLDMGCGYGALGLPVAALFPQARLHLVDRDLLAVHWSEQNAGINQLSGVKAFGSLGFRNVPKDQKYDWILCNVPARIGRPFIQNLIEEGVSRLQECGELRVVVITDLGAVLEELKNELDWPMQKIAVGPRHTIYSFSAFLSKKSENEDLYFRDEVVFESLALDRPFDLGGDDPKRLKSGIPVLVDCLPRSNLANRTASSNRIFCFRTGYGVIPLFCRRRWPEAKVVAIDRDLLGTEFTRRNSRKLHLSENLEVRENAHFPNAILPEEKFQLIVGELSPSAGDAVAMSELTSIASALDSQGEALILCHEKMYKQTIKPLPPSKNFSTHVVLSREGYSVLRIRASK